ncbi:MAG: prohibitin family protein [Candidatus Electrothrix sp. ATG2]|nr:prohibitin family protein [Candidatus Electrothrix sp. ATG2]
MNSTYQKMKQYAREYLYRIIVSMVIFLIVFLLVMHRVLVLIGPGEAGVLFRTFGGGTDIETVYHEGLRIIWPWDRMFIYNCRVQEYAHQFNVLTMNGLKVHLDLSIRYRPEHALVAKLHKDVGEDYVNIVVIPEIENVLRVLIGRLNAEQVYTTKRSLIEKAISEAIEQIAQRYVNVDNVIIKRMQLPESVAESVREKMRQKHMAAAYVFRLEREEEEKKRKRIEAEGLERFHAALSPEILQYMGIEATLQLAQSNNSKVVIVGGGEGGLPIIGNMPLAPGILTTPTTQEEPEAPQETSEKDEESSDIERLSE